MPRCPHFSLSAEYQDRLEKVRQSMRQHGLDGLLVSTPEDIYYIAGVNHWGFFAYHMLIVPLEGELTMIARAMESVTMSIQLTNARFVGYADSEDQSALTARVLKVFRGYRAAGCGLQKKGIPACPDCRRAGCSLTRDRIRGRLRPGPGHQNSPILKMSWPISARQLPSAMPCSRRPTKLLAWA